MHEVIMPKLGLTMETGVIEKWHKKEGDEVPATEVIAYIGQVDEEVPQGQASKFALKQERVEKISEDIEVKTIKPSKSESENKAIKDA